MRKMGLHSSLRREKAVPVRLFAAVVLSMVVMAISPGLSFAQIDIDISSSAIEILNESTFRLRQISIPPFGAVWADFQWDPSRVVFVPINAGFEKPVSTNIAPYVSNLTLPTGLYSLSLGQSFAISYEYGDLDGLSDVKTHHILMSDKSHTTVAAGGSGRFQMGGFYFDLTTMTRPYDFWVEVYVTDAAGAESNHIRGTIRVCGDLVADPTCSGTTTVWGIACGGIQGLLCPQGLFCDITVLGACSGADLPGVCTSVPNTCTLIYQPVCGCDGKSYGNDCARQMAKVQLDHKRACR